MVRKLLMAYVEGGAITLLGVSTAEIIFWSAGHPSIFSRLLAPFPDNSLWIVLGLWLVVGLGFTKRR